MRHGQAKHARGRCVGHTDVALSARGRSTIEDLSRRLAVGWRMPPDRITTSDLRRAAESASLLGAPWPDLAPAPHVEPRLRELDFGDWEGRRWTEIAGDDPKEFERCARHLVVAHAGSIRAMLAHCCGWSPARVMAQPIDHGHITMLDLMPVGARARGVNMAPGWMRRTGHSP